MKTQNNDFQMARSRKVTLAVGILVMVCIGFLMNTDGHAGPFICSTVEYVMQSDTITKKISVSELEKYAGDYVLQSETKTMDVRIFVEDGKLKAHPAGQIVGVMKCVGDHTFIHTRNADIRLVFGVTNGKAEAMTLHQRGRQIEGKRKR